MVRTDKLLKHDLDTEQRSEADLRQIYGWLQESKSKKQLFIVGNHWDSDPEYRSLTEGTRGDYLGRFIELPVVRRMILLAGGNSAVKVVLGSLATERDADDIIIQIFRQVEK